MPEASDAELDISVDSELMPLLPPGFLEAQVAALAGGPGARAPQLIAASDAGAACGAATGLSRWLCEHRVHMLWALAVEGAMLACVLAAYVALSRARRADLQLVRGSEAPMLPPGMALSVHHHVGVGRTRCAVAEPFLLVASSSSCFIYQVCKTPCWGWQAKRQHVAHQACLWHACLQSGSCGMELAMAFRS